MGRRSVGAPCPFTTLWGLLATGNGEFNVRSHEEGRWADRWVRWDDRDGFCRLLRGLGADRPVVVGAAARCLRSGDRGFVESVGCLWVRLETGEANRRLEGFRVRPTLVLRDGETVRCTAFWGLDRPLDEGWALRANERLSYALKGRRGDASPDAFLFRPPHARLVEPDRERWCRVDELNMELYRAREVVGGLADAPDLNGWRDRSKVAA